MKGRLTWCDERCVDAQALMGRASRANLLVYLSSCGTLSLRVSRGQRKASTSSHSLWKGDVGFQRDLLQRKVGYACPIEQMFKALTTVFR